MGDSLDELLSLAERSYIRLEAKELISQCLDQSDISLFNDLVERLVLAGSSSLGVMREIMDEIRAAKSLLGAEGLGARQDLIEALEQFGVSLPDLKAMDAPEDSHQVCDLTLDKAIRQATGGLYGEEGPLLQEICVDASERVAHIARKLGLLQQIEDAVMDWFNGLAYAAAHERKFDASPLAPTASPLLH